MTVLCAVAGIPGVRDVLRPRAAVLADIAPEVPDVRRVQQARRREAHAEPQQGHHRHPQRAAGRRGVAIAGDD